MLILLVCGWNLCRCATGLLVTVECNPQNSRGAPINNHPFGGLVLRLGTGHPASVILRAPEKHTAIHSPRQFSVSYFSP